MDYRQVIEDFNNGTIDRSTVTLILDSDYGFWRVNVDDAEDAVGIQRHLEEKYGRPNGEEDIVSILKSLGVNCERR